MDGIGKNRFRLNSLVIAILIIIPLVFLGIPSFQASSINDSDLDSAHVTTNNPVLVAGGFHYFDVTLASEAQKIIIIAYYGDCIPDLEDRSSDNYYSWEYDRGCWKDISGYDTSYLTPSKCSKENKTYIFYLGIDSKAKPGRWTIKVVVDDEEVSTTPSFVIVSVFNFFLSSVMGLIEPCRRDERILGDLGFICSDRKRILMESEKNIEQQVDGVLNKHATSDQDDTKTDEYLDLFVFGDSSSNDELVRSTVSTYHRSKLKTDNVALNSFFSKKLGGGNGFYLTRSSGFKKFLTVMLAIILLSVVFVPAITSTGNGGKPPDIKIINVQSYPTVGGRWTVMFTTIGRADLTITAINGTTWSNRYDNSDLRFLEIGCGNETLDYEWVNNSVFIANFSSNETCYETCKVLTSGKHHLEFDFGGIKAYAHNSANQDFKIQRGSTTIAVDNTTVTITAGTDYDAPTGDAFIRIVSTRLSGGGYTGGGGNQPPDHHMVSVSNPDNIGTNITFERSASDPTWDTYVAWEIIEYVGSAGGVNEIKVREAGTITVAGGSATTGVVSGISDDSDVVVFITGQRTDGSASGNVDRGLHTAQWNSAGDTATFTRDDAGNNGYVSYAVVEFTGSNWKVQRVTHQQTATGPQTENFGTELEDVNKTSLHIQTRTNAGNLDEQGVETWISSTTQLSFERTSTATATQNVVVWVIENNQTYGTPMSVEHISGSRGTGGSEPDIWSEGITEVNAMNTTSIMGENARSTGGGTYVPRGNIQLRLTGTSTVQLWASENGQTQTYRFSVVQWPTTDNTPPTSSVDSISPYWGNTSSLTITATASDVGGVGVKNVTLYWYNSTDNNTWSGPWNFGTDTASPWSWNFNFPNGTGYYRFYSIAIDNLSNTESFDGNDTACGYDTGKPSSQIDMISPYWHNSSDNPLTITETSPSDDLSGIKNITLYYRYRANNVSGWGSWNLSSIDENAPWSWSFTFPDGDGHYQFYSIANDTAGNKENPPMSPDNDTECAYDTINPSSQVDALSKYWYNETDNPLDINVSSATDSLSGVKNVTLYYRYRANNGSGWGSWEYFDVDTSAPWQWSFNFPDSKGHYQFYSMAIDNASNKESPPGSPDNDTECGYNTTKPSSEVDDISPYWYNSTPITLTGQATDFSGGGLKNVTLYYYNSTDNVSWDGPWKSNVDSDPWVSISWSFSFPNSTGYYRFYSIAVDNNSNIEDHTNNDTECGYDTTKPSSQVDSITPYWYSASGNPLNVTVTSTIDDLSGVNNVSLYYRYRADSGSGWNSWISFGIDEDSPWNWSFNFQNGSGYYQFYSIAYDTAGNCEDSPVSPDNDTECGYDTSNPSSNVNTISPYTITYSPITVEASASDVLSNVKNVSLYYRYSPNNWSEDPAWDTLYYDDFESGTSGSYTGGGSQAADYNVDNNGIVDGTYSLHLQDNTGANWSLTNTIAAGTNNYTQIRVDFSFLVDNFNNPGTEDWWFQYYNGSSSSWETVYDYDCGAGTYINIQTGNDWDTDGILRHTYYLKESDGRNLSDDFKIRFYCDASGNGDELYIDTIYINATTGLPDTEDNVDWTLYAGDTNPDESSPWSWSFSFPNSTGYYEFYSLANDVAGNLEDAPGSADAICYYNPSVASAPVINSYNLSNSTGSKLNNATGLIDVNSEYYFTINVTDSNEW
jgi:hypothetical protein